jgi:hypothetical protein
LHRDFRSRNVLLDEHQRPEIPVDTPGVFRQVIEGAWVTNGPLRFLADKIVQTLGIEISRQKNLVEAQLQSGHETLSVFETQIIQGQKQLGIAEQK